MVTQSLRAKGIELLVAYNRTPTLELRNKIVKLNLGLVRKVAHQVSQQCAEPYDDLEQTGYLGLIRAIERFDPHQGTAFSSFALPYIRGEMLHYLRDKSSVLRIPRRWQELYSKGRKVRKTLSYELGRPARETEVAEALNVSWQEWRDCLLATENRRLLSLDAKVNSYKEDALTLAETITDTKEQDRQSLQEHRLQIHGALSQLEERTQTAVDLVYLREYSRKEAAKSIGISPMTVTRHLNKGMNQLESLLGPQVA
ncbi:MAG: RNA polymerase sigma factor SigF [Spirulinaceae cyanobacterium]